MIGLDNNYWKNLLPPLAPSNEDTLIFKKNLLEGNTLLLGCTKNLIPLSDIQMDNDPWYSAPSVIVQDWTTNTKCYTNIIGDGVFNFTKELSDNLLDMCSKYCDNLIIRCFNRKLDAMKIAAHFPNENDFNIQPAIIKIFDEYTFYVWKFKNKI